MRRFVASSLPCIRQAKLVLSKLRIVMTMRKMTFVMVLTIEGLVLGSGFEIRVALQVVLRIRGCDVGANFIDVSVVGVGGDV